MHKKEKKILTALDAGETIQSISEIFNVSTSTITEIKKRHPARYKFNRKNPEKKEKIIPRVRISARIPRPIWDKIQRGMILKDISVSDMINRLIELSFDNPGDWPIEMKDCTCENLMHPLDGGTLCPDCGFFLPF